MRTRENTSKQVHFGLYFFVPNCLLFSHNYQLPCCLQIEVRPLIPTRLPKTWQQQKHRQVHGPDWTVKKYQGFSEDMLYQPQMPGTALSTLCQPQLNKSWLIKDRNPETQKVISCYIFHLLLKWYLPAISSPWVFDKSGIY